MLMLGTVILLAAVGIVHSEEVPTTHLPEGQEHKDVHYYDLPFGDGDQGSGKPGQHNVVPPIDTAGLAEVSDAILDILKDYIDGTVDEQDQTQNSTSDGRTEKQEARKTNENLQVLPQVQRNGTVTEDLKEKKDVPSCASYPCRNGASCVQNNGSFTCICGPGFSGEMCESDIRTCENKPCLNHATCTQNGATYNCGCRTGFTGRNCETDINECESSPCYNGATCVDGAGTYHCVCKPGFVGRTCLTDVRHCDSGPCLHGGTCVDGNGTYTCSCSPGFTGSTCEADTRHCDKKPCFNGATCTDGLGDFDCACVRGYSGRYCESDLRTCAVQPCPQNAICVDGNDTFACICREGYTGPTCDTDIRTCQDKPCVNGTCVKTNDIYTCTCIQGFTGGTCDTDINECESYPCFNDATCEDLVGNYNCICKSGFSGRNCVNDLRHCDSEPCFHGGTCVDGNGTYTCICSPGFTGATCEADTRHCDNQPCLNGATCIEGFGEFSCDCPEGFSGVYCESVCTEDKVDLLFMKDVSNTITVRYYFKMLEFMNNLLNELDVGPDEINVALSAFSGRVKVDFHLNEYRHNKTAMLEMINLPSWRGGKTYLALALEMALHEVFNETNGDRPDAKNVVILYTDGKRTGTMDITAVVKDVQAIAEVYMVLTTDNADMDTAERVVSKPATDHLFHVDDDNLVDVLKRKISTVTCRGT